MKRLMVRNNNKIIILNEISEAEYELINKDLLEIEMFQEGFEIFKTVTDGYKDYNQMIELFLNKEVNNIYVSDNINRFVESYLTSIKAFLDRWPTYLSRNFNSDLVENFVQATHKEYDESFSYRLLDQLRNYVQHCGIAPLSVVASLKKEEPQLMISFNGDTFIKRYKKLKPIVKTELEKMPHSFEITPHFIEMNACLFRIHNKMLNEIANNSKGLLQSCLNLLELILKFKNQNGDFAIIENAQSIVEPMDENATTNDLDIREIPLGIVKFIISAFIKTNR